MFEKISLFWHELSEDKKLLIKQICVISIALYVLLQLLGFLFPITIAIIAILWVYNNFLDKNPRVLK